MIPQATTYALADSKHAPKTSQTQNSGTSAFKPILHRRQPPPTPPAPTSNNTITLAQKYKEGQVISTMNYPMPIALINTKLVEANVKEKSTNMKPIQIR